MTIGDSVLRTEDQHLITGRTAWASNVHPAGALHLVFVRSYLPHARITVDVETARTCPDVVAAWTGIDIARWCSETPRLADDEPLFPLVAADIVRYVGEAVAVVVARSAASAQDAAELVSIDYDELRVVPDVDAAMAEGAPLLHPGWGATWCSTRAARVETSTPRSTQQTSWFAAGSSNRESSPPRWSLGP